MASIFRWMAASPSIAHIQSTIYTFFPTSSKAHFCALRERQKKEGYSVTVLFIRNPFIRMEKFKILQKGRIFQKSSWGPFFIHAENTQLLFSPLPVSVLLHFLLQFLHCQNSLVLVMKYALLLGEEPQKETCAPFSASLPLLTTTDLGHYFWVRFIL